MINLLTKLLKPKGFLTAVGIVLCILGYNWISSFTVVKKAVIAGYKEVIKADSVNISILANELKIKNDTISKKDTIIAFQGDIIKGTQQLLKGTKIMLLRAENEAKIANEAIEHYEKNNLMRYFVKKNKIFGKDCFEEQFEKPDCIK